MNPQLGEVLAALPAELDEEVAAKPAWAEIVERLAMSPAPTGSWSRLWSVGGLHAKVALAYAAWWLRSFHSSPDERARKLHETHLAAALKMLAGMTYLRGLMMKLGQMLAAHPKLLPAPFAETLGRLHFDAPPMHFALLREQVRSELGADPREVFASFETTAFAAASLGQVHRARLKSGERVAVKIQYPNIARTVNADFRTLGTLLLPLWLTRDADNLRDQFEDLRRMLELETDYVREAGFLRQARNYFAEHEGIVVPRVYDAYSTKQVLTMEYLDGCHLDAYLRTNPTQMERDHYGTLMMRSSFRLSGIARLWYADPHPGNYLFMSEGRLGLIDFGCCRAFSDEEWQYYKMVAKAYYAGEEAMTEALAYSMCRSSVEEMSGEEIRLGRAWSHWLCDCLKHEGPFDFGDEAFLQQGLDLMREVMGKRLVRSRPLNNWLFRNMLGLRAILFRLRARVDMKRINDEEGSEVYDWGTKGESTDGALDGSGAG